MITDRAIELQKQICERIEQEEPEGKASENYGYELIELATLYLANKMTRSYRFMYTGVTKESLYGKTFKRTLGD